MQKHSGNKGVCFYCYITKQESKYKGVDALYQIAVIQTEKKGLDDICQHKIKGLLCIVKSQPSEDQFFYNRCHDNSCKNEKDRSAA